jgi:type VI secretion system FHA domain protein
VTLTLEITQSSAAMPDDNIRHEFGEEGGTIGRAPGNSWVLRHSEVSKQHALITCRGGVFYIQDTSRNGVSVNSLENRLVRNRPYALKTGDRVYIEPYQIEVWVDAPAPLSQSARLDPFGADDPFAARLDPVWPESPGPAAASPVSDDVDPLNFFEPVSRQSARKAGPITPPGEELLSAHYEPPVPLPAAPARPAESDSGVIPRGYDPLRPDDPVPAPAPAPPPPPAPVPPPAARPRPGETPQRRRTREVVTEDSTIRQPAQLEAALAPPQIEVPGAPSPDRAADASPGPHSGAADLAELLAGAGVPDGVITPELSRNLGHILRVVVDGLMDILKSRQRIKEEFRMHQTMFRPADNNPLKFSVNVEDALHNLLVKRNAAYLGPVEAFADAFDDLRDHQLAMLAGMRVAFEAMLADFDPDTLQREFDSQIGKHALPLVPTKMRYWDLYRDRRQAMLKDPEATFDRLFGDEFRQAYEEQFRKLKASRRARTPERSDP